MKKLVYLFFLALFASGCGLYSKYKPTTTVDDHLYGDLQLGDTAGTFAAMDWHDVFTDPQLQALIERALVNNIDLQVAHEHVEQAKASLLGARLSYLPSIQVNPTGEFNFVNGQGHQWNYNLAASASWEIDIFGRTWNSMKRAKSAKAMAEDYEQAARADLIAGVAELYYTLLMLDTEKQVALATAETWRSTVEIIKQMKEAGMANEVAVSQLEASYFEIQTTVINLSFTIRQVENSLHLMLNEAGGDLPRGQLDAQIMPTTFNVGVPVQILYNRPDIRAAQEVMAQAHYARQLATANCLPHLSLTGLLGWTNGQNGVVFDPFTMIANAAGSLFIPIFQSGRNIAQVRAAKSQQKEARLQFAKVVLVAGNEVNEAMAQYQSCEQKKQLYQQQVDALVRAHEATCLMMKYGSTTYLDVLNAQNTLLNAQFMQIANTMDQLIAVVTLYHALGGGQQL
ncbi:MAG: TolC family protein [Paludibacteraceae bacterium]|nr:TolC family protein [Paludibacteraceae bacterium]